MGAGSLALALSASACSSSDPGGNNATDGGNGSSNPPTTDGGPAGCGSAKLLSNPSDLSAKGPWAVGAKAVNIGTLKGEVWYPAQPGSESGKTTLNYDIRNELGDGDKGKISDADNPPLKCNCYRDLPLDGDHGPYPVIVFVHGESGFATQSTQITTHWASRGFVVVAANFPGALLKDALDSQLPTLETIPPQVTGIVLPAVRGLTGDLSFLKDKVDVKALALAGHSLGGGAVADMGGEDGVQVIISMAYQGVKAGKQKSNLVIGGLVDGIAEFKSTRTAFKTTATPKRLVGVNAMGHLGFTDLCPLGADKGGLLAIAEKSGIIVPGLVTRLAKDGCNTNQGDAGAGGPDGGLFLEPEPGWKAIRFATSGVLEETLHCSSAATSALTTIKTASPDVVEFTEELK